MGYTTTFKGRLELPKDATVEQLRSLKALFGIDSRQVEPDKDHEWYYMDFELTEDLMAIQWNGAEKFYGATEAVNWLLSKMRETWPDFTLTGALQAQGEDDEDRWELVMVDGVATKVEVPPKGVRACCPDCGCKFRVEI